MKDQLSNTFSIIAAGPAAGLRVASSDFEDIALDIDKSDDAVMELNQKYAKYFS